MRIQTKKLITLICLFISPLTWSADHLLLFGAGGEKPKPSTMFDDSIMAIAKYVQTSPALKVDLALNGGHAVTEKIIADNFQNASSKSNFLASDYKRLLESYKSKLENNEMLPGDQLMIFIDSHGAQRTDDFHAHKIATSEGSLNNLNTLSGATLVDLDQLEAIKVLAKAKGVKLAIIDASCHSGATLDLADDNTCVISGSGPNHYSYKGFSQNFAGAMKPGKNLEQIFLETRAKDDTPALPMISTSSGFAVNSILYEKITPFLYSFDSDGDKLTPYIIDHNTPYYQCIADQNYKSLIQTIDSLASLDSDVQQILLWPFSERKVDFSNFKKLLARYKNNLDLITTKFRELGTDRLNNIENFNINLSSGSYIVNWNYSYKWGELMSSDFKSLISREEKRVNDQTDPEKLAGNLALLSLYRQAQTKKEELLKSQPDLWTLDSKEDEIKRLVDLNYASSREIAIEERKLYSILYQKSQEDLPQSQANPCRDFQIR